MSIYAPTTIDLSRVPTPSAIQILDFDAMLDAAIARYQAEHDAQRLKDPTLPEYNASALKSDPVVIQLRTWTFLRTFDLQRVNDVFEALLPIRSSDTNLDAIAASRNVIRRVLVPASGNTPAVMESDQDLLRQYLLSFDIPSAGSRDRYLYEAWVAWPQMLDARVNGHAIHGRRGDTDIVIIGPGGRLATPTEKAAVRAAVTAPHVQPEAVSVTVLDATRAEYTASLVIEIPNGPDAELVRQEAIKRVRAVGDARMQVGGEVPAGLLAGSAYGTSILRVRDLAPVVIEPAPYTVPILTDIAIAIEVRL